MQLLQTTGLPDRPVRLVGVGISAWSAPETAQPDLFDPPQRGTAGRQVLRTIDAVSEKFGRGKLQLGLPPASDT
jgi:hypothetical protein